ncbi:phosphatase family protein [Niveomyces insectorum RCEF 264]|uniref:Phosphatase family protein n=1 Tax=Niveomyces insectorum RCEF 264 TaxID=1081102 RepID=A0A167PDC1_9HYPO|nr:phosphatase family protein [Niveomyces insectorum RCEF 264]
MAVTSTAANSIRGPSAAASSHTSEPVDLASAPHSLHSAVYARRAEYVRPHRVRVKVGTWNVAACPGTDHDLGAWFVSGKGVDRRLANVDFFRSRAIEREASLASEASTAAVVEEEEEGVEGKGNKDPYAVRLVGGDKIGLYALGLQEVVDLNVASQYVSRVYADAAAPVLDKWKAAVEAALPDGYVLVAAEQMSGLLLLVYASPEVAPMVHHISTSAVGTGLLGMLGNKGAVSANIVLGETSRMAFVNSHLASGNEPSHAERRCWDVAHIASRTQFAPYVLPHQQGIADAVEPETIGDADFAFWFGDLNFRLDDLPGQDIRRLLTLHARGEYDLSHKQDEHTHSGKDNSPLAGEDAVVLQLPVSRDGRLSRTSPKAASFSSSTGSASDSHSSVSVDEDEEDAVTNLKALPPLPDPDEFLPDASDDPASLQATLDSLLPHDQLRRLMKERKVFYEGWREGRITFLPSYKYDVGTIGLFDSSEKQRAPSWCDRILYRTRKDKEAYEKRIQDEEEGKRKDEEMKARGLDQVDDDDDVLFEYQPDNDGDDDPPHQPGHQTSSISLTAYDEYDDGDNNDDDDDNGHGHGRGRGHDEAETGSTQEGASGDRIHLDIYTSHQRIQSSDHKPVVSVFTIDFDAVVPALKAQVHAEVAKELDRAENEGRPGVTIVVDSRVSLAAPARQLPSSDELVDVGPVAFRRRATASLTIANTGRVPATFSFVEKPTTDDLTIGGSTAALSPPYAWLTTSFVRPDKQLDGGDGDAFDDLGKMVTLEPGETVNALLDVLVDDLAYARMLNDGAAALEDVLVLRVVDGRDHFIPVRGSWLPTCIGRSMEELVRVPDGGIRAFVSARLYPHAADGPDGADGAGGAVARRSVVSGSVPYELEVRCSAPKELFKLTEAIENLTDRVVADEQMLDECKIPSDKTGWPFELNAGSQTPDMGDYVVAVIDALDNDRPLLEVFAPEVPSLRRLEIVSQVLLLFLRGLTDGIVTIPLWSRIDQAPLALPLGGSAKNGNPTARDPQSDSDKNTVLDVLSTAPHHNISFVFLTATLSRVIGELSPLSLADLDALRSISRSTGSGFGAAIGGIGTIGSIGRRSLSSFRKAGAAPASAALEALDRRQARERRYAEIFGKIICRAPVPAKEKDRRALEDKQRAVIELFLRRSREELG